MSKLAMIVSANALEALGHAAVEERKAQIKFHKMEKSDPNYRAVQLACMKAGEHRRAAVIAYAKTQGIEW